MDVVGKRVAVHSWNEEVSPVLLEVDAAAEVLERQDEDKLHDAQQDYRKRKSERASFLSTYTERRSVVAPAPPVNQARGGGRGRGNGNGGGRGRRAGAVPAPKLDAAIGHASAVPFLPPGRAIWRGLTRGEWCGHYRPNSRIHAKWADCGELGAMQDILRRLWLQHADYRGLAYPDCCPFAAELGIVAEGAPPHEAPHKNSIIH